MDIININTFAGLSNRLSVLLSYIQYAKENNKIARIIWKPDRDCNGFFLDYFEKIDGSLIQSHNNEKYRINFNSCVSCKNIKNKVPYDLLKLKPHMKLKLKNILDKIGKDFIGVHIRRTDHIYLLNSRKKHHTTDEHFMNFIDKYPEKKLYIATDNLDTQLIFHEKYKDRIPYIKFIEKNRNKRQTSLEDAVLDMYILANAYQFMGTYYSSFSNTVIKLRQYNINE